MTTQPLIAVQVGGKPDFADPVVLSADRGGITMEHLCSQIHKTLASDFSYALVWGRSSKHYPQRYTACSCGRQHQRFDNAGCHPCCIGAVQWQIMCKLVTLLRLERLTMPAMILAG